MRGCRISRAEVGWGVTKLVGVDSDSATLVVAITAGAPGSEAAASTGAEVAGSDQQLCFGKKGTAPCTFPS